MIKGVEGRVKSLLIKFAFTRDDDMKLFAMIIHDFYNFNQNFVDSQTASNLIEKIYYGKIPHFTSVLRCRQKLQEKCPELRGKKYEARLKHAETVKEEIKSFEPAERQGDLFNGS